MQCLKRGSFSFKVVSKAYMYIAKLAGFCSKMPEMMFLERDQKGWRKKLFWNVELGPSSTKNIFVLWEFPFAWLKPAAFYLLWEYQFNHCDEESTINYHIWLFCLTKCNPAIPSKVQVHVCLFSDSVNLSPYLHFAHNWLIFCFFFSHFVNDPRERGPELSWICQFTCVMHCWK